MATPDGNVAPAKRDNSDTDVQLFASIPETCAYSDGPAAATMNLIVVMNLVTSL